MNDCLKITFFIHSGYAASATAMNFTNAVEVIESLFLKFTFLLTLMEVIYYLFGVQSTYQK